MELIQKERAEMELSDKIRRLESEIQQVGDIEIVTFMHISRFRVT